jgi:AraC-like DNA-binding protein
MTAIRLAPEASAVVLGLETPDHPGAIDDAEPLLGGWGRRLLESVASATSPAERLARLLDAVRARIADAAAPDPIAVRAAEILRRTHGRVRMRRIAEHLGVSERHLRRRLRAPLGIGPKTYARQLRLKHAIELADPTARPDWARIAVEAGYFDQAHLVSDASALALASPTALHRERRTQSPA